MLGVIGIFEIPIVIHLLVLIGVNRLNDWRWGFKLLIEIRDGFDVIVCEDVVLIGFIVC